MLQLLRGIDLGLPELLGVLFFSPMQLTLMLAAQGVRLVELRGVLLLQRRVLPLELSQALPELGVVLLQLLARHEPHLLAQRLRLLLERLCALLRQRQRRLALVPQRIQPRRRRLCQLRQLLLQRGILLGQPPQLTLELLRRLGLVCRLEQRAPGE